ncbi:MAG: hypothetical protein ACYDBV_13125 [Nitrospiria bacterium]
MKEYWLDIEEKELNYILEALRREKDPHFRKFNSFVGRMGEMKTKKLMKHLNISSKMIGSLEEYGIDRGDLECLESGKTLDVKTTCKYMNPRYIFINKEQVLRPIDCYIQTTVNLTNMKYSAKFGITKETLLPILDSLQLRGTAYMVPVSCCTSVDEIIRFYSNKSVIQSNQQNLVIS